MAKPSRGGAQSAWARARATQPQPTMPTGNSTGGGIAQDDDEEDDSNVTQQTPTTPIPQAAGFMVMDDALAAQIRQANDAKYTSTVEDARALYISKKQNVNGYSMAQELNHRLNTGQKINDGTKAGADMAFTDKYLSRGMHQIGYDVQLQRGAHENVLQDLGIKNYQNLSEQQLQSRLVGAQWQAKAYGSTSYDVNKNPFLSAQSGSGVSGGREVVMNINAHANTKALFGARNQAEVILDKGVNYKITGVHYMKDSRGSQVYAYPRNSGQRPVVVLDIEVWS